MPISIENYQKSSKRGQLPFKKPFEIYYRLIHIYYFVSSFSYTYTIEDMLNPPLYRESQCPVFAFHFSFSSQISLHRCRTMLQGDIFSFSFTPEPIPTISQARNSPKNRPYCLPRSPIWTKRIRTTCIAYRSNLPQAQTSKNKAANWLIINQIAWDGVRRTGRR